MFEKLLALLLQLKGGLATAVVVVSTTGVVITGTVDGHLVDLTLMPVDSTVQVSGEELECDDLKDVRDDAVDALKERLSDRWDEFKEMADRAKEQADAADRLIAEADLAALFAETRQELERIHDDFAARMAERAALDLAACELDGKLTFDIATLDTLREDLLRFVSEADEGMAAALATAQTQLDALVANAQPRPATNDTDTGDTDTRDTDTRDTRDTNTRDTR